MTNYTIKYHIFSKNGPSPIIEAGSIEEYIVVNWMESDLGFCGTTDMVNQYCWDTEKKIGQNDIMSIFLWMKPLVAKVEK